MHTAAMGETYDRARLDLADFGLAGHNPDRPSHIDRLYRYRLRAIAEHLDAELGPLEHAAMYLEVNGARRLASSSAASSDL